MQLLSAVVVEDNSQQARTNRLVLTNAGYDVKSYADASSAIDDVPNLVRPVDLVVLDRKLPGIHGDEPQNTTGDKLLDDMCEVLTDTHFIVLTAYADVRHVQKTVQGRGSLQVGLEGSTVDRVRHFDKEQSLEFKSHVEWLAAELNGLSDIELVLDGGLQTAVTSRLLAKVCSFYSGRSIRAKNLVGGLSETAVWRCEVVGAAGNETAGIVVKEAREKSARAAGVQSLLPTQYVAGNVSSVGGFADGYRAQIAQLADRRPVELISAIQDDETFAVELLRALAAAFGEIEATESVSPISEIVSPIIGWEKLQGLVQERGIVLPSPTKSATTKSAEQHGDLHPFNVLVANRAPVVIDFDSQVFGSRAIDPAFMFLGCLFHKSSPMRLLDWPSVDDCSRIGTPEFLTNCPYPLWFGECQNWLAEASASSREYWSILLAYSGRQLKYDDVRENSTLRDRAVALTKRAVEGVGEG